MSAGEDANSLAARDLAAKRSARAGFADHTQACAQLHIGEADRISIHGGHGGRRLRYARQHRLSQPAAKRCGERDGLKSCHPARAMLGNQAKRLLDGCHADHAASFFG